MLSIQLQNVWCQNFYQIIYPVLPINSGLEEKLFDKNTRNLVSLQKATSQLNILLHCICDDSYYTTYNTTHKITAAITEQIQA